MERKEFLSLIGMVTGGALLGMCAGSCSKTDTSPASVSKDFNLDLTLPSNAALKKNGGYIVTNGVVVARTLTGLYLAVASSCTHEGTTVGFDATNNRFHCPNHGANFSTSGSVLNGPTNTPLQKFNTSVNGNILRVYS